MAFTFVSSLFERWSMQRLSLNPFCFRMSYTKLGVVKHVIIYSYLPVQAKANNLRLHVINNLLEVGLVSQGIPFMKTGRWFCYLVANNGVPSMRMCGLLTQPD